MRALLLASLLLSVPAWAVYQCGDTKDDCPCGAPNPYPCCDNGGNCTWYAWEAACCAWGVGLPGWGNANQWTGNAHANASYAVSAFPVTDAVSCRDVGAYGHVAFVTAVSGANITVHEQNCWGNYGMDTANYAASFFTGGFITRAGTVQCHPGDSQSQSCGNCGTQSRGCGSNGQWGGWGACSSQGACAPGAVDESSCGACGVQQRTCSASCQWQAYGACGNEVPAAGSATCDTGARGPCAAGVRVCVQGTSECHPLVQPVAETCNGVDDDCDGLVDGPLVCGPNRSELSSGSDGQVTSVSGDTTVRGGCAASDGLSLCALGAMLFVLLAQRSQRRVALVRVRTSTRK